MSASTNWTAVVATFAAAGSSAPSPVITTSSLPGGTVNSSYSATLSASGGAPPYTWSLVTSSGGLPAGLSLNAATGAISGTPAAAGTSNFTVQATDTNSQTATRALSITINPASSAGGIALIQSGATQGSGVVSVSQSFAQANTAGNLIIAFVRMSSTSQTVKVSDTAGNTYFDAVSQAQTTDGHQIHIFYAANIKGGANIVTASFSAANNHPWLAIFEYSGVNALDQTAHLQGSSTSASSGATGVTSSASELIFAGLGIPSSTSAAAAAGSGFALQLQDTASGGSRAATEAGTSAATGSFAGSFSLSSATNWSCTVATFRAGAVSSGSGVSHYEYVFPDGSMYVFDMDHSFQLVKQISLPQAMPIRGVAANPATHTLYISYGGDGGSNGNGSMLAYNLLTDTVMWSVNYSTGIDSMALTPDGNTIYMPTGEASPGNTWTVLNSSNGAVTASIATGAGPHNTVVSLDGTQVFMGPRNYNYLFLGSTSSNTVIRSIGPLYAGVRPFTINGKHTLAFTTATQFLGFQVSDTTTGQMLYTVPIAGFSSNPNFQPSAWSHGVSMSPDEKEVWVMDGPNSYVHVFDVTGLPASPPKQVADLPLTRQVTGSKPGCPYDCLREGWVQHSRDGHYVFIGDEGDVFDTTTRRPVINLDPLYNSRVYLEIDWQNGVPISTTTRQGLGYVTQ